MENTLFWGNREPNLDQVLAEPIVRMMMRRDGVDEAAIRRLMRKAAEAEKPPKLHVIPPAPPPVMAAAPRASIGVLAHQAQAGPPAWPRVFPSL